jgi:hypothetical protein
MPRADFHHGSAADLFDALAARSAVVHGNKLLLPVAAWVDEMGGRDVTTPEVVRGLAGQIAPNKALEALIRLCSVGALAELPHAGRPYPRSFEVRPSPYWDLVRGEVRALLGTRDG